MLKLGVNVDHVATLREARYRGSTTGEPDPVDAALECEDAGANGVTIHLREDRRHIQDRDVRRMRTSIKTRLNLELANIPEIVAIAIGTRPDVVCIVPENRAEITTEGGLDVSGQVESIAAMRKRFTDSGIDVSLFVDPDLRQIEASSETGAQFVELHTGAFADAFNRKSDLGLEIDRLAAAANLAHKLGLRVNAGHGLNYSNLQLLHQVPYLVELNIGHSIICRAITVGIRKAVEEMLLLMGGYTG
ncbi:MAG: pyridoxine 5'-phosphate synthase [Verrucomicrobia bacterium]|nr:pyridoxine 5'-phosphate synthase [Verrucomicrobiota bacterium]